MKNKVINYFMVMLILISSLSNVLTVNAASISSVTVTNAIKNDAKKVQHNNSSNLKSKIIKPMSIAPYVQDTHTPEEQAILEKYGAKYDKNDPSITNIYQVEPGILYKQNGSKDLEKYAVFLNQVIIRKTGNSPTSLEKGDHLDATTVSTILPGYSIPGNINSEIFGASNIVSAIPKKGFTFADKSAINGANTASIKFYTYKNQDGTNRELNADDLNDGKPINADVYKALGTDIPDNVPGFIGLANEMGTLIKATDDFPYYDTSLSSSDYTQQAYTYAAPKFGKDNGYYSAVADNSRIFSTYHLIYEGLDESTQRQMQSSENTQLKLGTFGMGGNIDVSDLEKFKIYLYDPLVYDKIHYNEITMNVANKQGNDSEASAEKATSDEELQAKTPKFSGNWQYTGTDGVDIYYEINPSRDSDHSKQIKIPDSDIDQNAKTFSTNIKTDSNNKFIDGKNRIAFYIKSKVNNKTGETASFAFYKLEKNGKPVVTDIKVDPNSMEVDKESDAHVTGNWTDPDNDSATVTYKIDDGESKSIDGLKKSRTKSVNPKGKVPESIVKNKKSILSDISPIAGGTDSLESTANIFPDQDSPSSRSMKYEISYKKSGNPNATTVGDVVNVTVKATAVKPYVNKVENHSIFMKSMASAFAFPQISKNNAFTRVDDDGRGTLPTAELKKKDGTVIPLKMLSNDSMYQVIYQGLLDAQYPGYSLKDSITDIPDNSEMSNEVSGKNKGLTSAAQVAFDNNMSAGDYLEFKYAVKVNSNAASYKPEDLKLLATTINGNDQQFEQDSFIAAQLPGSKISSMSLTPDKDSYSPTLTQAEMDNYSENMTGTYNTSDGSAPEMSYEVYNSKASDIVGHDTPGSSAIAIKDVSNGKYSANVSAQLKEGYNTIRFFAKTANDTTYADVSVYVEKKDAGITNQIDFNIPQSEIAKLAIGEHKISVFATDVKGNVSDEVTGTSTANLTIKKSSNVAPEISNTKVAPKTMEKGKEADLDVNGNWKDENDNDITKMTYSIDGGAETETPFTKDGGRTAKKTVKKDTNSTPSVVKKSLLPGRLIGKDGIQPLESGDPSTVIITDDGGQLTYTMSYTKSGSKDSTSPGDEITVTTKVIADKPQSTKINGQDVFIKGLNSAFLFPYATDDNPFDMESGKGTLFRENGESVADIPLFKQGDGSYDGWDPGATKNPIYPNSTNAGVTGTYKDWVAIPEDQGGMPGFEGKSVKGTETFNETPYDTVYSDDSYLSKKSENDSGTITKYADAIGQKTDSPNVDKSGKGKQSENAAYIALHNHMQAGDYMEFTYKYKVNDSAIGKPTDDLKFYSSVFDASGGEDGFTYMKDVIEAKLAGDKISPVSITPDQTNYDEEYTTSEISSAKIPMTGKYSVGTGDSADIKYSVFAGSISDSMPVTAPSDASPVTVNADGTYSADVESNGKFQEGLNTVRFYITSKNDPSQTSYADVTVNITKKIADHTYDFTIAKDKLANLAIGNHTVQVYAYDAHGAKSAVGTGTADSFEITKPADTPPVVNSIKDSSGSVVGQITEGDTKDYPLVFNWKDNESKSVDATYRVTDMSGNVIDSGSIGTLDNTNPGTDSNKNFTIPASTIAKLKSSVGTYEVLVHLKDSEGQESQDQYQPYLIRVKLQDLILPASLTFTDITVGSQRQLDTRDTGWDKIKRNNPNKTVTVYQSKDWQSSSSNKLSPIEFVNTPDQLASKRGNSIYGPGNAVNVDFKTDGSLNWDNSNGLFEPIATSDLADSYSTELTWQVADAPK